MLSVPAEVRRRSHRQWIAVPVRIRVGGLRVDGMTINLSEHGVYLFVVTNLSIGTEIEILYRPPGRKNSICTSGIVRRRAVFLYGVEFLSDDTAAIGIERTSAMD